MILSELKIHHLRNILFSSLRLNSRFNFIFGGNGSGKTSLLEAFYLLSCGHSFRTREISPIISHQERIMTVFGRGADQETISIQKSYLTPTQIKLNNQFCSYTSQLAYALPCQVFYSDIFQIIDSASSTRRNLLDWGLFHVKHDYFSLWKEYKKILKQRNALLKKQVSYNQFIPWDKQMSDFAKKLHQLREEYFSSWEKEFLNVLQQLGEFNCKITYYKGWDKKDTGKELDQILMEHFVHDKQKLYTQYGPHQADIIIEAHHGKAKHYLSRGQQKIILIALKLAQGNLITQDCLYLIDDLDAELDWTYQERIMSYLQKRKGQYVITSNSNFNHLISNLTYDECLFYHINNGILENVPRETFGNA